jgi:hypothetical protein
MRSKGQREEEMAGIRFLNPFLKIVLCVVGMLAMGYSLYPFFPWGLFSDTVTVLRFLVFLGFAYLLVSGLMELSGAKPMKHPRD